jgi:uncharacterized repeat protein (TIGR02543 family)
MKIILSSKRHHYVARVSIFLITLALVVEMIGCSCGGGGGLVKYDLTIASTAGGSVTTPGEGTSTYREGEVVDLVAEAEEVYHFVNWTGDVDDIANVEDATTTITMNDDYSITANFVVIYNLNMAANPVGGGTATDETNGSPYVEGTVVSIKAEANTGYEFVSWTAPAGTFSNATAAETTFTMPAQDVTITANFEPTFQLLIYEDDFSNPNSGWLQESFENYEYSYEDGEYHILVKNFDWSVWAWIDAGPFTDFALEIDARLVSGPSGSAYGVIFRLQNADNFYNFEVKGNGYYYLKKYLNNEWVTLQALTRSDFINEGNSTNHLKVVCEGSQIEVYVNGYHLATVTDDSFPDGYVGMIAYAFGPDTRVAFDNIKVYSLD